MTLADPEVQTMLNALRAHAARSREQGLEWMIVTIPMRRTRGRRVHIAPRVFGTIVGSKDGRLLVSARVVDFERFFKSCDESLSSSQNDAR